LAVSCTILFVTGLSSIAAYLTQRICAPLTGGYLLGKRL